MAAVYSTRFVGQAVETTGLTDLYTVPTGYVAVVRTIRLCPTTAGTTDCLLQTTTPFVLASAINQPQYTTWSDEGRHVLNAGEVLAIEVLSGTWLVEVSGYLLTSFGT